MKKNNPNFETIFSEHKDMVFRICMRYLKNPSDAEDITQNVFLKVHDKLTEFKHQSSLLTWIYRIAVNTCLDHLRMQKRRQELDMARFDSQVTQNITSRSDGCLLELSFNRILEEVNPKTREILVLSFAEGLSQEEVAGVMGVSRVAITKRLAKFREKFQSRKGDFVELGVLLLLVFIFFQNFQR
ncbi:MAG: RNA polymerase sigma factor [Fibrobacteria bacterium]|nr:RNA polymerase sigma factor [Fibrobacteria bacterium]